MPIADFTAAQLTKLLSLKSVPGRELVSDLVSTILLHDLEHGPRPPFLTIWAGGASAAVVGEYTYFQIGVSPLAPAGTILCLDRCFFSAANDLRVSVGPKSAITVTSQPSPMAADAVQAGGAVFSPIADIGCEMGSSVTALLNYTFTSSTITTELMGDYPVILGPGHWFVVHQDTVNVGLEFAVRARLFRLG